MKKGTILLSDKQKFLYSILNKHFSKDFEISNFLFTFPMDALHDEDDFLIYVVYNESELYDFLSVLKFDCRVLVCVFSTNLYSKISFLENEDYFFLLNANMSIKSEIVSDLSIYLNIKESENTMSDILYKEM